MTPAERDAVILASIGLYVRNLGYPPSIRELADALGCSTSTAHASLLRLERAGRLRRAAGMARAISVVTVPPC